MDALYPDYEWEQLEVTTSDGYKIALYHLWSDSNHDQDMGPVVWMHGSGMNPTGWIEGAGLNFFSPEPAPMIQMADMGHDIYMVSNRGNADSLGHEMYDFISDAREYWDFSFHEFANDVVASGRTAYE